MPDHIHIFIGLKPVESVCDLLREIKKTSNNFINTDKLSTNFDWQNGYGTVRHSGFSNSRSQTDNVCKFIFAQKEHHKNNTFQEKFLKFCNDLEIEIGKKQLFEWFD